MLALPGAHCSSCRGPGRVDGRSRERDGMRRGLQAVLLAMVIGSTGTVGQTKGPIPLPGPTIYSAPTPAPLAPPINPGPAVVPPAGLSPLLTEPGPLYPVPRQALPDYPPPQLPGPVGQQNMQSYRNSLLGQQWRL